jgi:hypothetical protein
MLGTGCRHDAQRDTVSFDFADEAQRRDWSFLPAR